MAFKEEAYLQLSGVQHFSFCRRQWALIHIEQQWAENLRTIDGRILHEKAHDGSQRVQNSVFECVLDAAQCRQLQHKLRSTMDEDKDSLRFYYLGNRYQPKIEYFGVKSSYEAEGVLII